MDLYKEWKAMLCHRKKIIISDDATDTEMLVRVEDRLITLDFQACGSKADWLQVFMVWKKYSSDLGVRIHAGMYKKFKSIQDDIDFLCTQHPNKNFTVRGYSQGGGLALMVGEYIARRFPRKVHITAFAPLRVSNRHFLETASYITIRNKGDIVTYLPPRLLGYKPTPFTHVLNADKKRCILPRYHKDSQYEKTLRSVYEK